MRFDRFISLIGLLLFLAVMPIAHAAGAAGAAAPDQTWHTSGCSTVVTNGMFALIHSGGQQLALNLVGYGAIMLRAFLIISLAWYGAQMMLSVGTALAEPEDLIMKVIGWGAIFTVFENYGLIYNLVSQAFAQLGQATIGSVNGNTGSDTVCTLAQVSWHAIDVIAEMPAVKNPPSSSFWDVIFSGGDVLHAWLAKLYAMLELWVLGALLFIASLIYLAMQVLFSIYLALAFGLGPLAIPMAMTKTTRSLFFDSWVGFMWTALMYQVVGPAMLALVALAVQHAITPGVANGLASTAGGYFHVNLGILFFLYTFALLVIYLMLKLPTIVQQLSSGAAHIGDFSIAGLASKFIGA